MTLELSSRRKQLREWMVFFGVSDSCHQFAASSIGGCVTKMSAKKTFFASG